MHIKHLSYVFWVVSIFVNTVAGQQAKPDARNRYPLSGPVQVKTNLSVLDADGKHVEGIKAEDVKIFEDGVEQKITAIRHKIPPAGIGLVVDNSGSLRLKFGQLIDAAKIASSNLADSDQAFVIRFISSDKIEVLQDFTSNKNAINKAIDGLYIEGGRTAMIDALTLAVENVSTREQRTPNNRFAILVFSDGTDVQNYFDLSHLNKLTSKSDVQIFPIFFIEDLTDKSPPGARVEYERSNAERLANVLAIQTGGISTLFQKKPSEGEMRAALKQVMTEIRSQYIIEYTSTNQKRDGRLRTLRVEIANDKDGKKRSGSVRESFVVPLD